MSLRVTASVFRAFGARVGCCQAKGEHIVVSECWGERATGTRELRVPFLLGSREIVEDGRQSWGVVVPNDAAAVGSKRHNGEDLPFGGSIKETTVVSCAVTFAADGSASFSFGVDGKWEAPLGEAFSGALLPSKHVAPAVSLRKNIRNAILKRGAT